MGLLEYENQMFLDAFQDDGLLICARGLGLERVFTSFLKLYSDPGNLVLVLNTTPQDEEYFRENLEKDNVDPMPNVVTADINVNERRDFYMKGGVLYVTSRILVVDMLTERVPTELITGILVYKAHKIIDSCQEAFILRLYREKNKTGFIKAFSDSPLSFTAGFCHVERVMKSLFVRKLFLWPRFEATVVSTMEKHKVDVVEIYVHLTSTMQACQTALVDLIDACVKELKRCNITLDSDEFTLENAMTRSFDKIVRLHMEPVWHQLSPKTKQLVTDIKTLRLLLEHLTQYDCVNFYNLVSSLRGSEKQFGSNSGWLFMDSADSLFVHAKERVVTTKEQDPSKAKKQKLNKEQTSQISRETEMVLEECPKWKALKEILCEIEPEAVSSSPLVEQNEAGPKCGSTVEGKDTVDEKNARVTGTGNVLIAVNDDRTCAQLRQYLCEGSENLLKRLYERTQDLKSGNKDQSEAGGKGKSGWRARKKARGSSVAGRGEPVDIELAEDETTADLSEETRIRMTSELGAGHVGGVMTSPCVVLHALHGAADPFSSQRALQELQPTFVVMYDADIQFVRQVEVFRASRPGKALRVYFLMYEGSTEEQRYLTALRKEKEAFEYLIREKSTMVIPEEREGRMSDDPVLSRDSTPASATVASSRRGGAQQTDKPRKVVVDMREFRSELPSLIHRRGIDIEPVTIEVGDYIVTPDICVERKSVSDLIGSLNNGRLYNQCVAMCRHYTRPVLLIEFDPNKSFALQGKYELRDDISSHDVISRLTLLTLHFPRLRIFWCQSPYATAELIDQIKLNCPEPDALRAVAISGENDDDLSSGKYNHRPQAMLLKMPGVNTKNIAALMNKLESIAELVTLSKSELTDILGSEINAGQLHRFLHRAYDSTAAAQGTSKMPAGANAKGGRKPVFYGKRKQ